MPAKHRPAKRSLLAMARSRVPTVLGLIATSVVVLNLLAVLPPWKAPSNDLRSFINDHFLWIPVATVSWAIVSATLAAALFARKRVAAWAMIGVASLFVLDSPWHGGHLTPVAWVGIGFNALIILATVWAIPEFAARTRRGSVLKAAALFLVGMTVASIAGTAIIRHAPGTLPEDEQDVWALIHVAGFGISDSDMFSGSPPLWAATAVSFLGAAVVIASALLLFRSQRSQNGMARRDTRLLHALIERYGAEDSLAYFGTRRDKSVVFSPNGLAAITYRVEFGVCIASGDPVGDPDAWDDVIHAYLRLSRQFGWAPAVMGASAVGAEAFARHDLTVVRLGDEAVIHTERFSLRGPTSAGLRQAVNRARRAGLEVRIRRQRDIAPDEFAGISSAAADWRGTEHERGFSMALGRVGDPADGDCLIVEACQNGTLMGLLSFVPWGGNGISLDLMRRSPHAPNGTTELMVSELCRRGEKLGLSRISLNFAVFRSVFERGEQIGAGPISRISRTALIFMSRWWQLESLYRANEKYAPEWVPRFLAFADSHLLGRIALASASAEGFVTLPLRKRLTDQYLPDSASLAPIEVDDLPEPERAGRPRWAEGTRVRLATAQRMQAAGVEPWPTATPVTATVADLFGPGGVPLIDNAVRIGGRVLRLREHGKVAFADLRDWSGDVQVVFDETNMAQVATLTGHLQIGDLISVSGHAGASKNGTPSFIATDWTIDAKCLHPIPDPRVGLTDPEARVRQRYVDMAVNTRARDLARARAAVLQSLRTNLYERNYLEVETPILQTIHGGANARPFETHINAYNLDMFLRIAPELFLKRLCVGGMDRVFEIGRAFRNEGVDWSHNPEFTILEAYEAHGDYITMMHMCRELIQAATIAANGECVAPGPDGNGVDISGEWPIVTLHDAVSDALVELGGHRVDASTDTDTLRKMCDLADVPYQPGWDAGEIALEMYEHLVEEQTTMPTFYCDFPVSVSPLTRSHRSVAGVTERWDLVAWGMELGTAYSELTDPIEQRKRLTDQSMKAAGGDPEAMELDEDFLTALEYGMPPSGGLGMGVDRVIMMVTGASIRDTLPFPLVKPRD